MTYKCIYDIKKRKQKSSSVFLYAHCPVITHEPKENRTYIRGEFKESFGMNFFSPFQPEREFKVCKSCKCSQIIAVEYINVVCSLEYPFQFQIFKSC